jgi:nucleoside-diphosphate-sugar epimerase
LFVFNAVMTERKVLITGGSGTVGSWLIPALKEKGYKVINIDLSTSNISHTYRIDLCDFDRLRELFEQDDFSSIGIVIHLAGKPSLRAAAPDQVFAVNVISTFNLLELALSKNMRNIIMASSEAVLGFSYAQSPVRLDYLPVDEKHLLQAQDAYGLSKISLEQIGEAFAYRYPGTSITSLRFSMVLQPSNYQKNVARLWADSNYAVSKLFSYVDIRDALDAIQLAMTQFISAQDTFMRETTQELIEAHFDRVPRLKANFNNYRSLINTSLARRLLGFRPKHTWREYLK